ncbi:MAG: hypothetical protein ACHRHE_01210 [Tepidisphaerales bacterium]
MTKAQTQLLQSQLSDTTQPGTILRDFQAMLDFIGPEGLPVASKHRLFPMKEVPRLNERLGNPLQLQLERPQLRSYPNVAGLYMILRASGLGVVRGAGEKARLMIEPAMLERWNRLRPLERYLNLFAAWTLRSSGEMVGDDDRATLDGLPFTWSDRATVCYKTPSEASSTGCYGRNKLVFAMFGMMEIESGHSKAGKGWWPTRVQQTDFGQALMAAFTEAVRADDLALIRMTGRPGHRVDPVDCLRRLWAKLFPAWKQLLADPKTTPAAEGTWLLKVSLGRVWRQLAVPCDTVLADLASIICDVFDFDFDHLYEFIYTDTTGTRITVCDHREPDGLAGDEVTVGEALLHPGEQMQFRYDFGDNWEFLVEAGELSPETQDDVEIVKEHGKAPAQYGDWEDEDE